MLVRRVHFTYVVPARVIFQHSAFQPCLAACLAAFLAAFSCRL